MDYIRKKRWVSYYHTKCKMYLRNDFGFECAYCRMREQDAGVLGEDYFEKDHFVARASKDEMNKHFYDNMIYACSKCNGNKSAINADLLLNPCVDDIYQGLNPHVKNLGKDGHFLLHGNTVKGRQYIELLQLNSKFYREMREKQEQSDASSLELRKLLNEISERSDIPDDLAQKMELLIKSNPWGANVRRDDAFRCGHSQAGQAFQDVLDILKRLKVPYELLFADEDIDIKIRFGGKEYLCEIVLNNKAVEPVRHIHVKEAQRECWLATGNNHGVLYYYLRTGRLEFYSVDVKNKFLTCLCDHK